MLNQKLIDAAAEGQLQRVEALLARGADVDFLGDWDEAFSNNECYTALHVASSEGHVGVVRALIKAGADINQRASVDKGLTSDCRALHLACETGRVEVVDALLAAGAPVDTRDRGVTPLMGAAIQGHESVVERLLASGADPNIRNDKRRTILDRMVDLRCWRFDDCEAIVELLLAAGAGTNDIRSPVEKARDVSEGFADQYRSYIRHERRAYLKSQKVGK